METTERILLVILSAALAVFLLLGIIALVKIIQILNRIKKITEKAEDLAEKAEAVGEFFQRSAVSAGLIKLAANIFQSVRGRRKEK